MEMLYAAIDVHKHVLQAVVLDPASGELRAAGELEWSRAVADSSHVQAKKGAPKRARARLIEPETGRSTISWSTRPGSRSPGLSRAATATTSPS